MKDSDSNRSPSDDEKHTDLKPGQLERGGDNAVLLPDPDAGLSEAERKAIVRFASCRPLHLNPLLKMNTGPQTPLETRHPPDPLALPPLPHLLPRPHQHRQCQTRRPARHPPHHGRPVQCLPDHLLHLLLALRAPDEYFAQAPAPVCLYPNHHAIVGDRHGNHGLNP